MRYNNQRWSLREIKYICKQEKPHLSPTEIDVWAEAIYKTLNKLNEEMARNNNKHMRKNIPFSEYYAYDKYSNYFDEENEF